MTTKPGSVWKVNTVLGVVSDMGLKLISIVALSTFIGLTPAVAVVVTDREIPETITYAYTETPTWRPVKGQPHESHRYKTTYPGGIVSSFIQVLPGVKNVRFGMTNAATLYVAFVADSKKDNTNQFLYDEPSSERIFPNPVKKLRVWVDGYLLVEDASVYPYSGRFKFVLPYPVNSVYIEAKFSSGDVFKTGINTPLLPAANQDYDTRKAPMAPKHFWNTVSPGSLRYCISSPENGTLESFKVTLKKHPIFAKNGDQIISDMKFHMPVYQFLAWSSFPIRKFISPEKISENQYVIFEAECKTGKGVVLRNSRTIKIPRHYKVYPSGS